MTQRDLRERTTFEFNKLLDAYLEKPITIISQRKDALEVIFYKLFFLVYLSRRFETKKIFESEYFKATISFLLEGFMSLSKNIPNGSLLLLRSAIENHLKFLLDNLTAEINERSYVINHNKMLEFLDQSTFIENKKKYIITSLRGYYGDLSSISHSFTELSDIDIYEFYSDVNTEKNMINALEKWETILNLLCEYAVYQSESSLKKWEYWDLYEILNLTFSKSKSRKLAEFMIDNAEF